MKDDHDRSIQAKEKNERDEKDDEIKKDDENNMNSLRDIYIQNYLIDATSASTRCIAKFSSMFVEKLKKIKMKKSLRDRLKRHIRYMYLLYFRRFHYETIIENVYDVDVISDSNSRLYQFVYWQINDWIKTWKNRSLDKMTVSLLNWDQVAMLMIISQIHVRDILKMNDEYAADLETLQMKKTCTKWFLKNYSVNAFTDVFNFIARHIDIKKLTSLAHHYCQSMYLRALIS